MNKLLLEMTVKPCIDVQNVSVQDQGEKIK